MADFTDYIINYINYNYNTTKGSWQRPEFDKEYDGEDLKNSVQSEDKSFPDIAQVEAYDRCLADKRALTELRKRPTDYYKDYDRYMEGKLIKAKFMLRKLGV